ncbi:MAG: hypothetical protein IKC10_03465 [Alphaproteobacteria bacterium]|nr:hypothetical protein [Alphaproteobacteria bacterium]
MKWFRKKVKHFKIENSGTNNTFCSIYKPTFKDKLIFNGNNNEVKLGSSLCEHSFFISIEGNNNKIIIGDKLKCLGQYYINIVGNDNSIIIDDDLQILQNLKIWNSLNCQGGKIRIGKNVSFYDSEIHLYDDKSSISIGDECIFAYNAVIHAADGHAIFQNNKLINQAKKCVIGKHCWIGRNVLILKNTVIPNGCIVAANTTICKKYNQENTIITNNGIVKTDIHWDRKSVNEVLNE